MGETLKLYGARFALALALGLPIALMNQAYLARVDPERLVEEIGRVDTSQTRFLIGLYLAFAPLLSLGYAVASYAASGSGARPPLRAWVVAVGAGSLVFVPAALLLPRFAFLAVAWLGLLGLVVPVALHERTGVADSVRRALQLGRADYVHAFGALATLTILFWVTRNALVFLLREQAENTLRVAVLLADVVLSPVLFIGAALLYVDQTARVGTTREERAAMRRGG